MDKQLQGDMRAGNVAKLTYQATRAARGISTANHLTSIVDLASGVTGMATAGTVPQAVLGAGGTLKSAAHLSGLTGDGQLLSFASKALPVVGKGMGALGMGMAGLEVGRGVKELMHGDHAKAQDDLVDGAADSVASGAMMVAGSAAATGVGAPVAAAAIGVAAAASAVKLGYDFRDNIGQFAGKAGHALASGFEDLTGIGKA